MQNNPDMLVKRNRSEGYVIECDGMHAIIAAEAGKGDGASKDYWSVGQMMSIACEDLRIVGILYEVETVTRQWDKDQKNLVHIHIELVGEVKDDKNGNPYFTSGLSAYPHLGAIAHRIRHKDLAAIFENNDANVVSVGALSQNRDIPALISVDSMISRHFAVVGTTGVGKSTSISLLLRKIVKARPDMRVLILDPHNEFATAMPEIALTIDDGELSLPYWLFTLEELAEVLFNGRNHVPEEIDILRELIPQAKAQYKVEDDSGVLRKTRNENQLTADTPVPYRMADLIRLIDERLGKLDSKSERLTLRSVMNRLKATVQDPRYAFMFANKTVTDNLKEILGHIFRIPDNGKPVAALQLSGIPSEIVNAVVSVLCRLAFDLSVWSKSKIKTLIVCEEAHRYIPADRTAGFGPTRAAIARIAKEGRKYGVHLAVITQRPGELDETILSQCNTFFAMRLGNELDQEIMRKAISGGSRSFINFIPSLANREAIAFGQGASTPMRMMFEEVPRVELPGKERSEGEGSERIDPNTIDIGTVIHTMRSAHGAGSNNNLDDEAFSSVDVAAHAETAPQRPSVQPPSLAPQATQPPSVQPTAGQPAHHAQPQQSVARDDFTPPSPLRKPAPSLGKLERPAAPEPARRPSAEESPSTSNLIARFRK